MSEPIIVGGHLRIRHFNTADSWQPQAESYVRRALRPSETAGSS